MEEHTHADLDHIYIIISAEFEKDRLLYLNEKVPIYLKKYFDLGKVSYIEPFWKGRDDIHANRYNWKNDVHGAFANIAQILLFITYIDLFKYILENTTHNNVLIFESDVIFSFDFVEKLQEYYGIWKEKIGEPSVLFIGSGYPNIAMPTPLSELIGGCLFKTNQNKCTDSMIMGRDAIKIIYDYLSNANYFDRPIDNTLDLIWGVNELSAYWVNNPIVMQGSANDIYPCNVYKYKL